MSVPRATLSAAMVVAIDALALPSKDMVPVTSPVSSMVRAVVREAAVPVVLALIVAGRLRVTAPAEAETVTSSAVPVRLVTPVLVIVKAAVSDPDPEMSIPDPAAAVAT